MARVVVDLLRGSDLDNLSRIHHGHAVGGSRDNAKIVRDENCCGVELFLNVPQEVQNLRLNGYVESRRRLVGQQNFRARGKGDGHDGSLAHAAGKIVGIELHALHGPVNFDKLHELQHAGAQSVL